MTRTQIDPRGMRFVAAVTTVVLAIALITSSAWILAVQSLVFASAVVFGLRAHPYGWLFRRLVRPRIGPPAELEDAAPPRFAQAVGLVFALVATIGYATGADLVGTVATALALAAAFLNAAFGFCLGCETYLLIRRVAGPRGASSSTARPVNTHATNTHAVTTNATNTPAATAASKEVSA